MEQFELPLLTGDTSIVDAFKPMIQQNVSGLVVTVLNEYRLLHFTQVRAAWEQQSAQLKEIGGFVPLVLLGLDSDPTVDYDLFQVNPSKAVVRSRHENESWTYSAGSPGYSCSGPLQHTYPPQRRGPTNQCVVIGCPGTI
jgi:hypothetical protein